MNDEAFWLFNETTTKELKSDDFVARGVGRESEVEEEGRGNKSGS